MNLLDKGRNLSSNQRKVHIGKDCVRSQSLSVIDKDKLTYTLFNGLNGLN